MPEKQCCHANLAVAVLRVAGEDVPYSVCSHCGNIWLDMDSAQRLDVAYCASSEQTVSDFQCPRCREVFLETCRDFVLPGLEVYQCRKCSGIRIHAGSLQRLPQENTAAGLFARFLYTLSGSLNREVTRKRAHKLPSGFSVNRKETTDCKCPCCDAPLSRYRLAGTDPGQEAEFDICDTCYGIWLDKEDMQAGRPDGGEKLHVDMDVITPTQRTCPKCKDIKLVSLKYRELDTIVDCCPDCLGTWLDGGELQEFADFLGDDGQTLINTLIDNALFKDPVLTSVLKQFSRTIHRIDARNRDQERNLEQAREIQEKLIYADREPNSSSPQTFGDYAILSHWIPARVVGGDYFAVLPFQHDGRELLGVCIADVSGKGLPASLLMANLQALLNAFARRTDSPADLCNKINPILCNFTTSNKFITFFYGVLDPRSGRFTYCNAGHNPPVYLSADGHQWLKTGGSVLSFFPQWPYEEETIELRPRDRILFYTDGASETENPAGEEFGEARLASRLRECRGMDLRAAMQFLIRDIKEYNLGHYSDDTTMLLLERKGQSA